MQKFLLIITVIAFMIFGFFIIGKVDEFFAENYKGFDDEDKEHDTEDSVQKDENEDNLLQ